MPLVLILDVWNGASGRTSIMSLLLVIESDVARGRRIEETVSGTNHRVLIADSVTRALELAKTGTPDLVLVGVPTDMDQIRAIASIRKEPDSKEIPIALLAEGADPAMVQRLKQLGVMGIVSPQAPPDLLKRKVLSAIAGADKLQLQLALKRSNHVNVKRAQGQTRISLVSNLRDHAFAELRVVLNAFFLRLIKNDQIILDIRLVPEMPPGDARLVEQIVTVLGGNRVIILAGKHLGLLVSGTELASTNTVFLSEEELEAHLSKVKS